MKGRRGSAWKGFDGDEREKPGGSGSVNPIKAKKETSGMVVAGWLIGGEVD